MFNRTTTVPARNLASTPASAAAPHNQQPSGSWSTPSSGTTRPADPYILNFSIPGSYSQSTSDGPILVNTTTVEFPMTPPLVVPDGTLCNLTQASFPYTQPNVAYANITSSIPNGNNRLTIKWGAGLYQDILLPTGLYSYPDVQQQLNIWMRTHDADGLAAPPGTAMITGATDFWTLIGLPATQQLVITVNPAGATGGTYPVGGVEVNFTNPTPTPPGTANNSIGPVLGYPTDGSANFTTTGGVSTTYTSYAPLVAGFSPITAYYLYASFVKSTYINGKPGSLLYVFPLGNVTPNAFVEHYAPQRVPMSMTPGSYSNVTIWTTDQQGNRLPWSRYLADFQFSVLVAKNRPDGSL